MFCPAICQNRQEWRGETESEKAERDKIKNEFLSQLLDPPVWQQNGCLQFVYLAAWSFTVLALSSLRYDSPLPIAPQQHFAQLGPGRPLVSGPRMDGRVVTSLGIVNISRLASRLRCSARGEMFCLTHF